MDNHNSLRSKIENHLYDHPVLHSTLKNSFSVLVLAVSAFVFALGYKCFLVPNVLMQESGGGIDVFSYYIALKKSVLVGKYNTLINICTLTIYTILGSIKVWNGMMTVPDGNSMEFVTMAFYSVLYLMVTSAVIDTINILNKNVKITVITSFPDLARIIISALPHGATVFHGQGAFTGKDKIAIDIVVSSYEVKNAVKVIRESDPSAFIEVTELKQVYGRFFLPPIK